MLVCYWITLGALKLLYDEQQVYTRNRHLYLREDRVENYSVSSRVFGTALSLSPDRCAAVCAPSAVLRSAF